LNPIQSNEEWRGCGVPGSPEVHYDFLSLGGVQDQVVVQAPLSQMLDLLSVVLLIIVGDDTHHNGVVSKLQYCVGGIDGRAVLGEECDEGRAEHTALRCYLVPSPHILWSVGIESPESMNRVM